jgi:hypothetical protein
LDGVSFSGLLSGKAPAAARGFFWHFPHYTNQGSRPSGAMREGDWMLVKYYDEPKMELYNLTGDIGERDDVAPQNPGRVARMNALFDGWLASVGAQTNRPNPKFDPAKYRELYIDVDASRFDPATASPAEHQRMQTWRKAMDAVLSTTR